MLLGTTVKLSLVAKRHFNVVAGVIRGPNTLSHCAGRFIMTIVIVHNKATLASAAERCIYLYTLFIRSQKEHWPFFSFCTNSIVSNYI